MNDEQTVFIVDDEPDVRMALSMLIRSVGLTPELYEAPQAYLDAYDAERGGCLVLDMRMPGMSGLDLQKRLAERGLHPPIIMISGHGEIPNAVQAVQNGAVDFLQKPVSDQLLLDRINQALEIDRGQRAEHGQHAEIGRRYDDLTPRERQVLWGVVDGKLNKIIAHELGVSTRTVEIHRSNLMNKMNAGSLSELVRMSSCIERV